MPCHLQDCESRMSLKALLVNWRPAARLWLLPCRAQIYQCNAGLVRILHSQQSSDVCFGILQTRFFV